MNVIDLFSPNGNPGGAGTGPGGGAGTGPTPTGPPAPTPSKQALANLIADVESLLVGPLDALATAASVLPSDDPARRDLNAAASHINCALVRLERAQSPARRSPRVHRAVAPVYAPGGPVQSPQLTPGDELTPSSAADPISAGRSIGVVAGAGADVRDRREGLVAVDGRAAGACGAATFSTPPQPEPPRFAEGEHRLVGEVQP